MYYMYYLLHILYVLFIYVIFMLTYEEIFWNEIKINPLTSRVHKMVKHTLKTLQDLAALT